MKHILAKSTLLVVGILLISLQSCKKDPVNNEPTYSVVANWQLNSLVETIHEASTGTFVESNTETFVPGELSMHIKNDGFLDLYEGAGLSEAFRYSLDKKNMYIVIHGMDWGNDTFNVTKLDNTNLQLTNVSVDVDFDEKVTTLLNMTKK